MEACFFGLNKLRRINENHVFLLATNWGIISNKHQEVRFLKLDPQNVSKLFEIGHSFLFWPRDNLVLFLCLFGLA